MGVLLFAFFNFDILVKIEYRKYRDEWAIALGQAIQENHSDSFIGWVARVDSKVQI